MWLTAPPMLLTLLVQLSLFTGTANVHGGTGYTLLLLAFLVPLGLIAVATLAPLLLLQRRSFPRDQLSKLHTPALLLSFGYVLFCGLLLLQFLPFSTVAQ